MNNSQLFEAAQTADEAKVVLKRDGHRSREYWQQVSVEFEKNRLSQMQKDSDAQATTCATLPRT